MVNSCVVVGCTNRANAGNRTLKFFDIPTVITHQGEKTEELSRERRRLWLARLNRANYNPDPNKRHYKVCSDHFISGSKADLYDNTNPDWAPSLRLGPSEPKTPCSSKKRCEGVHAWKERKERYQAAESLLSLQDTSGTEHSNQQSTDTDSSRTTGPCCTFQLQGPLDSFLVSEQQAEIDRLWEENHFLREKLCFTCGDITLETFKDEETVLYYTGLKYVTLVALFNFLEPHIKESTKSCLSKLSKFQKLILVLMKLRLNLGNEDLGYRFKIVNTSVSVVFLDLLHVMYMRMKCMIVWPEREELRISMPMEFRKHFVLKVSIIIDCFEVLIERPSNISARAETWSSYKHHNTAKYLIGLTPQGAVSFLSKGYCGQVTDKFVTEDCGLLSKLIPGDIVVADRGFNNQESVGLCCAEVIPALTKGKMQLSHLELEATRKVAHTRIYVERVIGLVRNKYTILRSTIPIDYLHCQTEDVPTLDKITTVCCALTNLCESFVPFE